MSDPVNDPVGAINSLRASVEDLAETTRVQQEVIDGIEEARRTSRTNRIIGTIAALGLAASVGAVSWLGVLYGDVSQNTRDVQQVEARTSGEVLCPLYALLESAAKNSAPVGATPDQIALRNATVAVINRGYAALDC